MEETILEILAQLRSGQAVDDRELVRITHAVLRQAACQGCALDKRSVAKRRLLPFYQRVKREEPDRWRCWEVTPQLEEQLLEVLRMKPRRTASGVATITVITKPWPCSGSCVFCPSDIRCPKSYLADEPACERAVMCGFDPYLQVSTRLTALTQMGHATDKVELIVLGGTWSDYPKPYQIWFVRELFRALNEAGAHSDVSLMSGEKSSCQETTQEFESLVTLLQQQIDTGKLTYNQAWTRLYDSNPAWQQQAASQVASWEDLEHEQRINESAQHRAVGLVVETRPDAVNASALAFIRRLGATKVQMGVQSLNQKILDTNGRGIRVEQIATAFELLRAFGFKIHVHAMANLVGATPSADRADYLRLVTEAPFQPDEIKLYPCALIGSSRLRALFEAGAWQPYTEDELLTLLVDDVLITPPYCRISRMIRDFSTADILAGNKKPNLRQLVEAKICAEGHNAADVAEIRFREVGNARVDVESLELKTVSYVTTNSFEYFLQWVAPDGRIAGFCRLSLPNASYVDAHADELPIKRGEAMIREVHVYGVAARLGEEGHAAQHLGLGRSLIEKACEVAQKANYVRINVISAVGTRDYYRRLGFVDNGLYQQRNLKPMA